MRQGKETYPEKYRLAIEMENAGKKPKEIAEKLGISYSCAYHWAKGLRKPSDGNVSEFISYLDKMGPMPVAEVKEKFKKHNELFLISSRRNSALRRHFIGRKYAEYGTWYLLKGQEKMLDERIAELLSVLSKAKEKLAKASFV